MLDFLDALSSPRDVLASTAQSADTGSAAPASSAPSPHAELDETTEESTDDLVEGDYGEETSEEDDDDDSVEDDDDDSVFEDPTRVHEYLLAQKTNVLKLKVRIQAIKAFSASRFIATETKRGEMEREQAAVAAKRKKREMEIKAAGGREAMWERNIAKRRKQLDKDERRLARLQALIKDANRRELSTVTVEGDVMTLAQARLQLAARSESVDTLRTSLQPSMLRIMKDFISDKKMEDWVLGGTTTGLTRRGARPDGATVTHVVKPVSSGRAATDLQEALPSWLVHDLEYSRPEMDDDDDDSSKDTQDWRDLAPQLRPHEDGRKRYVVIHENLAFALASTHDGDEVLLGAGVHEGLYLVKESITIRGIGGADARQSVIITNSHDADWFLTVKTPELRVSDLTLRQCAGGEGVVRVHSGHVTFERVDIVCGNCTGVRLTGDTSADFLDCLVSGADTAAISLSPSSRCALKRCTITGNGSASSDEGVISVVVKHITDKAEDEVAPCLSALFIMHV